MLVQCKTILRNVIANTTTIDPRLILTNLRDESEAIKTGGTPFAVVTTHDADFDNRHARIDTYYDSGAKAYKRRYVRGERRIPYALKIYTDTEQQLSDLLGKIIPAIPREFTHDNYEGRITIAGEVYTEPEVETTEVNDIEVDYDTVRLYSANIQVLFAVVAATPPQDIPTATSVEQGAEQQSKKNT